MIIEWINPKTSKAMSVAARLLGKNLKTLRVARGYTQKDIAKLLNVTTSLVGHWEVGTSFAGGDNLDRLAKILGVSHSDLLLEDGAPINQEVTLPETSVTLYEAIKVVNKHMGELVIKKKSKKV